MRRRGRWAMGLSILGIAAGCAGPVATPTTGTSTDTSGGGTGGTTTTTTSTGIHGSGTFACGPKTCDAATQLCGYWDDEVYGTMGYDCADLPAACVNDATLECMNANLHTECHETWCTGDAAGFTCCVWHTF